MDVDVDDPMGKKGEANQNNSGESGQGEEAGTSLPLTSKEEIDRHHHHPLSRGRVGGINGDGSGGAHPDHPLKVSAPKSKTRQTKTDMEEAAAGEVNEGGDVGDKGKAARGQTGEGRSDMVILKNESSHQGHGVDLQGSGQGDEQQRVARRASRKDLLPSELKEEEGSANITKARMNRAPPASYTMPTHSATTLPSSSLPTRSHPPPPPGRPANDDPRGEAFRRSCNSSSSSSTRGGLGGTTHDERAALEEARTARRGGDFVQAGENAEGGGGEGGEEGGGVGGMEAGESTGSLAGLPSGFTIKDKYLAVQDRFFRAQKKRIRLDQSLANSELHIQQLDKEIQTLLEMTIDLQPDLVLDVHLSNPKEATKGASEDAMNGGGEDALGMAPRNVPKRGRPTTEAVARRANDLSSSGGKPTLDDSRRKGAKGVGDSGIERRRATTEVKKEVGRTTAGRSSNTPTAVSGAGGDRKKAKKGEAASRDVVMKNVSGESASKDGGAGEKGGVDDDDSGDHRASLVETASSGGAKRKKKRKRPPRGGAAVAAAAAGALGSPPMQTEVHLSGAGESGSTAKRQRQGKRQQEGGEQEGMMPKVAESVPHPPPPDATPVSTSPPAKKDSSDFFSSADANLSSSLPASGSTSTLMSSHRPPRPLSVVKAETP